MGKRRIKYDEPDGPAIIRPSHEQTRVISPFAGAPKGWRDLPPIEAAYLKGQLGKDKTGSDRYEAGKNYAQVYCLCESSGRDSTQALNVARSGGGGSLPQSQINAILVRRFLHKSMGPNNAAIIEGVCGLGKQPAEAMRAVFGKVYEKATIPRFNEALDSLVVAFAENRGTSEKFFATRGRAVA